MAEPVTSAISDASLDGSLLASAPSEATVDDGPQQGYEQHYDEIDRREKFFRNGGVEHNQMPRLETEHVFEYDLPDQTHAVVSFAAPRLTPMTRRSHDTAFKICGVFACEDAAREFAVAEVVPFGESVAVRTCRDWHIIPEGDDRDPAELEAKKVRMLGEYATALRDERTAFDARVERVRTHGLESDAAAGGGAANEGEGEGDDDVPAVARCDRAPRHPRALEVRGQDFAVVSVVNEPRDAACTCNECLFQVHGAFATEHAANAYMVNAASDVVVDVDMYVVPCYQWIAAAKLEGAHDAGLVYYRNEELHGMMRRRREREGDVPSYMRRCDREQMSPSVTEIRKDGVIPPPRAAVEVSPSGPVGDYGGDRPEHAEDGAYSSPSP